MKDIKKLAVRFTPSRYKGLVVEVLRSARIHLDPRKRALPDFIIIGTQKGGTTSLFRYLNEHPGVKPSLLKGTFFFFKHHDKGQAFYRANFPTERELHIRGRKKLITGESSADYMYHPGVHLRISNWMPDIKLLSVLRNPVTRSISEFYFLDHYQATTHTFADHVHRELDEISADLSKHKSYAELFANRKRYPVLLRSLYALQLEPWLDVFDRSQLYVVQSEDLYEKPHVVMQGVNRFLELAENTLQDYPAYNVTKGKREINDTIIKDLESFFEPYNKQLNLLLGQSFSW